MSLEVPLEEKMRGEGVAALHEMLAELGFEVESAERKKQLFGPSTAEAVRKFQADRQIERSGVVDRATADAIEAALGREPDGPSSDGAGRGVIVGRVITSAATTVPGAGVTAFAVGLGREEGIAEGSADEAGEYRIEYDRAALDAGKPPDLVVRATFEGSEVGASEVRYNAPSAVVIDVVVPPEAVAQGDEYGRLLGDITPHIEASPDRKRARDLEETPERRDVTYLANKTGWDARAIAMVAAADQFASKSKIPGELFYALFRAGLPANEEVLARTKPEHAAEIWKQSIESGVISKELEGSLEKHGKRFAGFASGSLLEQPASVGVSSLSEMLDAAGVGEEEREKVASAYTTTADRSQFWKTVEDQLGEKTAARVANAGRLGYLTVNNAPLIRQLSRQVDSGDPAELVRAGLYDPAAWSDLLAEAPVPEAIPGEDEKERKANYAELLASQLEISYPTAVVAAMVEREELPVAEAGAKREVAKFLAENHGRFELGERPVESYLREQGIELSVEALAATKTIQRQYQLSSSSQAMKGLATGRVDSAYAATRYGEGEFVTNFAESLGGEQAAKTIYAKAQQVHLTTLNVATTYLMAKTGPGVYGVPGTLQQAAQAATNGGPPKAAEDKTGDDVIAYPTLEQLFGELDYCTCTQCRSMLSAAAYLVDLLMFCDKRRFNAGGEELPADYEKENPLDVLLSRRPDIAELQLTCENTNVALPYVDLVNEVLEHFVVEKSLKDFAGHNVDPEQTSEELIAGPAFTDPAAYTVLAEQSYPLQLPFQRPLAGLRAYVGRVDATLAEAMEVLRASEAMEAEGEAAYGRRDVLIERLGVDRGEYALLTDSSVSLAELYGEDAPNDAATIAVVGNAKTFARRLDLDYDEVVALLRTRFVNPQSRLLSRLERLAISMETIEAHHDGKVSDTELEAKLPTALDVDLFGGDPVQWLKDHYDEIGSLIVLSDPDGNDLCSFDKIRLQHALSGTELTPVEALRLLRFVRLWRRLGWKVDQVDRALTALWPAAQAPEPGEKESAARTKLDAGFAEVLLRLGHLRGVIDSLGLNLDRELPRALALWAPIDAGGPGSLYRKMFLEPSLVENDPAFAEDESGEVLTGGGDLVDHQPALEAAFNLKSGEFEAILEAAGFDGETDLTLDNVSTVFRWGFLARRLKLSVRELVALAAMTGIEDPFAEPVSPRPPLVRLLEQLERLRDAGVRLPLLMYLLQHDLQRGAPAPKELPPLVKSLHDELARIDAENALVDDPAGDLARAKMALVYGQQTADTFMALVTGTIAFDVAYAQAQPELDPTVAAAAPGLGYDHLAKRLRHAGLLSEGERDAVQALPAATPALSTAVGELYSAGQKGTSDFFAAYPELEKLHESVMADPPEQRPASVLANFLPDLRRRLQELYLLQVLASDTDLAPADVDRLLRDPSVLHAIDDAAAPALDDLIAVGRRGASMDVYDGVEASGEATTSADAVERLEYAAPDNPLPANSANPAASVSGVWRWRLDPPANGFYAFSVDADAAASVQLQIDGEDVAMAQTGTVWETQDPIELKAGGLVDLRLTVEKVRKRMVVNWQSSGLPLGPIPTDRMLPGNLVDRFEASYVRLLKVLALAAQFALDGEELAWFATRPELEVAEAGWLNALPVAPESDAETVEGLFAPVLALTGYMQLRRDLKLRDRKLLDLLREPEALNEAGASVRSELTGWPDAEVTAVLDHLGLSEADLGEVEALRRVQGALAMAKEIGVPAATLIAALTNDPDAEQLATIEAALRAGYDEETWHEVAQPVNDELRDSRRDALVAYVVHYLRSQPATEHIDTPDKLFEWLLIDVQMEPCMKTSRIRQALSSVQLFVQRCLLNLEPRVAASSIDAKRWSWMQRYRIWEANRKVFLMPENWCEPELRDDKSPLFKKLEGELLAGDITEEAAATALGHYLEGLSEVAKLEVDGMFVEEGAPGAADDVVHVIARTAGARRKYYYRRQSRSAWSAWQPVPLEIEDAPVIPVVWRDRLFLFWLRLMEGSPPETQKAIPQGEETIDNVKTSKLEMKAKRRMMAMLQWSEYFNGAWQPPHTSDPNKPLELDDDIGVDDFDRGKLSLFSREEPGSLKIEVDYGSKGSYFRLFTPHSLPVRGDDDITPVDPDSPFVLVLLSQGRSFDTDNGLSVYYFSPFGPTLSFSHDVLGRGLFGRAVEPRHPLDDVFSAPFFFEDRRNVLFVRPQTSLVKVPEYSDLGVQPEGPSIRVPELPQVELIPKVDLEDLLPKPGDPYPEIVYHGGLDTDPVETYVKNPNILTAIGTVGTFVYGSQVIAPTGGIADVAKKQVVIG